ncbi:MAG TPA: ABC transporter ATP-binding protein [Symbiobacteriaceae bacterium]|nr:ABC transporter ATP-binding protein [Symbiobacteriaceae bacterium]
MEVLEAKRLTLAYDQHVILKDLDLAIPAGKITTLVGRNGCGKSTLLRTLARLLKPQGGAVYLNGSAVARMSTKDVARQMGILPQSPTAPDGLTVRELVAQGRYPHQSWLQQWSEEDERQVARALAATAMTDLAERPLEALSGGQRQRAWIAMVLAQGTKVLLLDEPTTYLDMAHQIDVLDLLYRLNREEGRTVVMVLHDLNLACRYAHHLVAMRSGAVYAQGTPAEVMTEGNVQDVFGMDCRIVPDPVTGTPLCVPLGCYQAS